MELGKLRYIWFRPIALLFFFVVACLGSWLLYVTFFTNFDPGTGLFPALHIVGFIFTGFGIIFGIEHYIKGITYTQKGKVSLNELSQFVEYGNGLLIVFENHAKLLTYQHKKILDRGYVKITKEFDRHKKSKRWWFGIN